MSLSEGSEAGDERQTICRYPSRVYWSIRLMLGIPKLLHIWEVFLTHIHKCELRKPVSVIKAIYDPELWQLSSEVMSGRGSLTHIVRCVLHEKGINNFVRCSRSLA